MSPGSRSTSTAACSWADARPPTLAQRQQELVPGAQAVDDEEGRQGRRGQRPHDEGEADASPSLVRADQPKVVGLPTVRRGSRWHQACDNTRDLVRRETANE